TLWRGVRSRDLRPSGIPFLSLRVSLPRPLRSTVVTRFAATMSRSDSPTEPPQGYAFPSNVDPPWATPPGLPGSSTDRSPRAVPNYPGEPGGCGHPLLHHRWQASSRMAAWPLSVCVTRPNRVRLRYGSRVRLRQASSGESLHRPLARLPVEWVITGQAPFSLQDQPGLSWHSIHRAFCDVCEPRRPATWTHRWMRSRSQNQAAARLGHPCTLHPSPSPLIRKIDPITSRGGQ